MPTPLFDAAPRHRLITDLDTTFVVDAGAGTGKTHTLVARIVSLVANGRLEIGALAAITFTEAAAAELRDRIRGGLDREATNPDTSNLSRDYCRIASDAIDEASIQTIHAFCGTLLRTFPLEASLPPGFTTWDTLDQSRAFDETFRAWLRDEPEPGTVLEADLAYALRLGLNPEDLRALASRYAEAPVPGPSRPKAIYGNGAPANPDRGTDLLSKRDAPARVSPDAIDAVGREVLGTFDAIEALLPRARKGEFVDNRIGAGVSGNGNENSVSQSRAWVSARCSTMLRMGSPWSMMTSRSGRVPATAPQAAAFHTAVRRPMTATPTAAPSAICDKESMGWILSASARPALWQG